MGEIATAAAAAPLYDLACILSSWALLLILLFFGITMRLPTASVARNTQTRAHTQSMGAADFSSFRSVNAAAVAAHACLVS